jgi:fucose 4-O-acetylase-like acetyltransferase
MATARAVQSEGVLPGIAPQREPFLDIARGIGILLVLYGHSLEWLFLREDRVFTMSAFLQWRVLYAFHMPVFFLISGAVNRRIVEKRPREVLANALGLVLLANLHHLVAAFMQLALDFRRGTPVPLKFIPRMLFRPVLTGSNHSMHILWFLIALAVVQVMAYVWMRFPRIPARVAVAALALASFVAGTSLAPHVTNGFELKMWFPGLVFFLVGLGIAERRRWPPFWLSLPLVLATVLLVPLNTGCNFTLARACPAAEDLHGYFAVWMAYGSYGYLPLFYLTALLGCLAVLSLARGVRSRALEYCGRNSLELFFVNAYLLSFVVPYLARRLQPFTSPLLYLVLFAITVGLHFALLSALRPGLNALRRLSVWGGGRVLGVRDPRRERAPDRPQAA